MPLQTSLLDDGNFVCSPEAPPKAAFSKYLYYADRLLNWWREAGDQWNRQPHVPELGAQKRELDAAVADFRATFRDRYGVKQAEQDPAFWPVSKFFAACRPVREPLSILHADWETPLHTVCEFQTDRALAQLNAALDVDTPLAWWRPGLHHRPSYLFGTCVWELTPEEAQMSEPGIVLLFQEFIEARRHRRDRLLRVSPCAATSAAAVLEFVPEKTRTAVWRRARGKCEQCGARDGLDFILAAAAQQGRNDSPQDVQLLCGRCHDQGQWRRR